MCIYINTADTQNTRQTNKVIAITLLCKIKYSLTCVGVHGYSGKSFLHCNWLT